MSNEASNFDSLNEQTRLINIALKYTNGDMDKARMMVSGQYNDVAVIKGRLTMETIETYGVFFIFLNQAGRYLMNLNSLLSEQLTIYERAPLFNNWKNFYREFGKLVQQQDESSIGSYEFNNHFANSLEGYNIFEDVEEDNLEDTSEIIREIIAKYFNNNSVQVQIAIDRTNSLTVELENIPIETPQTSPAKEERTAEMPLGELDQKMNEVESQAEYIINGNVIVSPVKGKYVNDIKMGEKISVVLTDKDSVSIKVAKMFNALTDEREYLPIKARLKAKIPMEGGGYILYGLVAKNVLVKIIEEENVKIEMEKVEKKLTENANESKLILYVAMLLGLVVMALVIIMALI